jgi:hypothetical protein
VTVYDNTEKKGIYAFLTKLKILPKSTCFVWRQSYLSATHALLTKDTLQHSGGGDNFYILMNIRPARNNEVQHSGV